MARITRAVRVANGKFLRPPFGVALVSLALLRPAIAAGDDAQWPQMRVPQQVETFEVGQDLIVNGAPARMLGFVSRLSPAALAASFRQSLGQPLMEDRRSNSLILGRGEGRYYMTVQLDPSGSGTRGMIAMTKPRVNGEERTDAAVGRRLLSSLPPGSTLASHTSSVDGGIRAEQDAVLNSHSIGVNSEYVQRMLRADGFNLERESRPSPGRQARHISADSRTLFFKRRGAEAIAVLFTDDSGKSVLVLNRVHFAGHTK